MRLYIDTNVVISLVAGEFGKKYEFMEERVRRFLAACEREGHVLIVSDWMMDELKRVKPWCTGWMEDFASKNAIEFATITKKDFYEADELSKMRGVPNADACHVKLAQRSKADAIITWDTKDFQKVSDMIAVLTPEQFI